MRSIKISDEVWRAIAAKGSFGETEDDVLRRVFGLEETTEEVSSAKPGRRGRGNRRLANKRMSARIESGQLLVEFDDGNRNRWKLPDRSDKQGLATLRATAVEFALNHGASDPGQTNAVRKALTDAGYHLSK